MVEGFDLMCPQEIQYVVLRCVHSFGPDMEVTKLLTETERLL